MYLIELRGPWYVITWMNRSWQACSHEPEKYQHTEGEQGRHALSPGHCSRCLRHDALPSTALRRHVCYGRQLLYRLYGVVREPHLTTADEMDYRGQGLLLVRRRCTHRLHHIKECQGIRADHGNGLLCKKVHRGGAARYPVPQ